jgi:hypothetical protein
MQKSTIRNVENNRKTNPKSKSKSKSKSKNQRQATKNCRNTRRMASYDFKSGAILIEGKLKIRRAGFKISGNFKEKNVVVHPTLLSCLKRAKVFSPINLIDIDRDFLLPSANCINLIQSKDNRLVIVIRSPMQYKVGTLRELEAQPSQNMKIFKELTIRFDNSEMRDQWLKVIVAECEKNYLREVVFSKFPNAGDESFFKAAYQEIWIRIILDWSAVEDSQKMSVLESVRQVVHPVHKISPLDAVRKLFIHTQGSIELDVIHQTLFRVVHWMRLLLNFQVHEIFTQEHASLFVRFLIQAVVNHGFRVLLFLFEPTESFLTDFVQKADPFINSEISATSERAESKDPAADPAARNGRATSEAKDPNANSPARNVRATSEAKDPNANSPARNVRATSEAKSPASNVSSRSGRATSESKDPAAARNGRGNIILSAIKFLNYVEAAASKDLASHRPVFEKAHHPLADVQELQNWPHTSHCAEESAWNESSPSESATWETIYLILHYPPFLPYVLIMKELDSGITDETMGKVVDLMQDLPPKYYGQSFIALNTMERNGTHFNTLADFCKFRDLWKVFAVNQLIIHPPHGALSPAFAERVFYQMWGKISRLKPQLLTKMFLLREFDHLHDLHEHSFVEALHGEILFRLAQKNDQTMKVMRLGTSKLPDDAKLKIYLNSRQTAFVHVEKLQFLASRVIRWIELITGRPVGCTLSSTFEAEPDDIAADTDATLFILIWSLCVENFAFRAFLMTTKPSEHVLDHYLTELAFSPNPNHSDLEKHCALALHFVKYLTNSFQTLHSRAFYSFLLLFSHPIKDNKLYATKSGAPIISGINATEVKFVWDEEITWMQDNLAVYGREWDGFELSYAELKNGFTETPYLAFQLFWGHIRVSDPLQSLTILKRIPADILHSNFYFGIKDLNGMGSPHPSASRSAELVYDTHFISLVNMYRLDGGWKFISPISQDNHTVTNLLVSAVLNIVNRGADQEDQALIQFFTPVIGFPNLELVCFKDILPLLLSTAIKEKNQLFTVIFNSLLEPKEIATLTKSSYPVISEVRRDGVKSFIKHLLDWLLQFFGFRDFNNPHDQMMNFVSCFAAILRQCIYSPSFRTMICLVEVEFGLVNKAAADTGEEVALTAKRLIDRFIAVSSVKKENDVQNQSLGYFAHSCQHPSVETDPITCYTFKEIKWDEELNWFNQNQATWVMSIREFQLYLLDPVYLAFQFFVRTHLSMDDLSQFLNEFKLIPKILLNAEFDSCQDYLTRMGVDELTSRSHIEENPLRAPHFALLLEQPIFQEIWHTFVIPAMRPIQFVNRTYLSVWRRVFAQDSFCNLQRMFHFSNSRETYSRVTFVNFLQCKLLVTMNKRANVGVDRLFSLNRVEAIAMKNSVAHNEQFIEQSNIELVVYRIMQWTQCLCSKQVAESDGSVSFLQELTDEDSLIFVELLEACIKDSLFRVFLFLFLPSAGLLQGFVNAKGLSTDSTSERNNITALIDHISSSIKRREWKSYRSSLVIFSYPKPNIEGECNPSWEEESKWIKELYVKRFQDLRIDWEELNACLSPSPVLAYMIMTKIIKLEFRSEIIQGVAAEHLCSSFALPIPGNPVDHHFYYLCVDERLGEIESVRRKKTTETDLFAKFIKSRLVNDLFAEKSLSYALRDAANPRLLSAYEIMRELIISTIDDEPRLRLHTLCVFSNLAQIVIKALYDAANNTNFARSIPIMCRFVELLLFLENTMDHPELSNLIHVTKLFQLQPRYIDNVSHSSRNLSS